MPLMRRILLTGILVFAVSLAFLVRGPSLLEAAPSASSNGLVSVQVQLPTFDQVFSPETIGPGSISTLQFTINNTSGQSLSDMTFTNALSAGLAIAVPASATSTCGVSSVVDAPEGGTTITFSDGKLGIGQECTVTVNVTGNVAGTYTSVSSNLNTSVGTSGTSTDDLTIATDLPGFSKSFSPNSIDKGERTRLTFTIDNGANTATVPNLDFTDNLPTGMVIADPANAATTCGTATLPPTLTAVAGTTTIVLDANSTASFPSVAAGAACTVTVDVIATGVGEIVNVSDELLADFVTAGKASAVLTATRADLHIEKSFTDDPVPPGSTVTLDFTISNFDRNFEATGVAFTDDLDAALTGLTFSSLLANECGGTVTGVGTTAIGFSGGTLAAGTSCTISASLTVPASAAPGNYTNTTTAVAGTIDGVGVTGNTASEDLFVEPTPLFTKEFVDDPVAGGGTVTLRYMITNTSTGFVATGVTFEDDLSAILGTPLSTNLTQNDVCGTGSTVSVVSTSFGQAISLSNGTISAGDSCTFDVLVDIPVGFPGGSYASATSKLSAVIDGATVTGNPASDTLEVVAAPTLRKRFVDDPVLPGQTVGLEFILTLNNNAPADATNISFTDDLNAALPGLASVSGMLNDICGSGSSISGGSNLVFTGGTLSPGTSCTFVVNLLVPAGAAPGGHTNITSDVTATVQGATTSSPATSDVLKIAGLTMTKSFTDDPALPGGNVTLQFTIENISGEAAMDIEFTDNLSSVLSGLTASGLPANDVCGTGSSLSGTNSLSLQGGELATGASCTFSVVLNVPANAASSVYFNKTSNFQAVFDGTTIPLDNASDVLTVSSEILALSKSYTNDPVLPGNVVNLQFTLSNLSPIHTVTSIQFSDEISKTLVGLASTSGQQSNICGPLSQIEGTGFLSFMGGELAPSASCTFNVSVQVPTNAVNGSVATNTTSEVSGLVGSASVTGAAAVDNLQIANVAVTAEAGGPYTVAEGSSLVVTGTTTTAGNVTFDWDLDNNGSFETPGQVITLTPTDGDSSFTIRLRVRGTSGNGAIDTATVNVLNVAPTVTAGNDQTINEGDSIALAATFTDPGVNDTHTISVDWGDGSANGSSLNDSHTYADDGSYTVTVTVTDDDGGVGADSFTVTVNNVAPTVDAGNDQTINEGDSIALAASFTDPGVNDTHTISVDWGDGSANGNSLNDNHTYADDGSYTVTVTVTDDDGGVGADSFTVTVNNVAPTVTAGNDQTINEGDSIVLAATFTDPGVNDTHTVSVNWGDGSPNGSSLNDSHTYADDGSYTVTVTVTDDDSGVGTDSFTVTVNNVAPTVDAGPDRRVFEDEVLSITATFSDPGVLDTHTATIDWGDGSPVENGTVNQTAGTVSGSHIYPEIGSYTVTVTVTDDDNGVGSDTFELSVDNGFLQNCLFSNDKDMKIGKESQVACNAGSIGKSEVGEQSQVTGNVAAGDEIKLKKESHVSGNATSAEAVELENDATVGGTISQNTGISPWAATTLFPTFSVNATGADVKVEKNQSLSLSPGNYGKLDAKENTTLTLAPGEYIFEKLDIDKNSLLIISGPTVIQVEDDVKLKQGVHIQADATDLLVLGGKNIDLEKEGVYVGSFLAPTGNVKLKQASQFSGLLYGESVDIEKNSSVNPGPALELIAQTVSNLPTSSSGASGIEQVEESSFQIFVPTINR